MLKERDMYAFLDLLPLHLNMSRVFCAGFDGRHPNKVQKPCQARHGEACTACLKLRKLESSISEARRVLEDLLEQHRQTTTEMNRIHNPLILQVPREITSMIFTSCFPPATVPPDSLTVLPKDFTEHVTARLDLGAVCREWRHIAWSTPRLWTELAVRLHSPLPWNAEIIQQWLDRSGVLPLSICVFGPHPFTTGMETKAKEIIRVLDGVSDRWRILELNHYTKTKYFAFFAGNGSSQSMLQALALEGLHNIGCDAKFVLSNAKLAPTRVVLGQVHFQALVIDWYNVTSLVLKRRNFPEYSKLLQQTPNLQDLTLDIWSQRNTPPDSISLPKLVYLHINGYVLNGFESYLNALVVPNLQELKISEQYIALPMLPLVFFAQHFKCKLKKLTISGAHYDSSEMVPFLENFPSLECLTLAPSANTEFLPDELLMRLARSALQTSTDTAEAPFLPQLGSLVYDASEKYYFCEVPEADKFPWQTLSEILGPISECNNLRRRPLRNVELYFQLESSQAFLATIPEACYPALLALLNSNLRLKVECITDGKDLLPEIRGLLQNE